MRQVTPRAAKSAPDGDRSMDGILSRGFEVLRCFTPQETRLANSEIAARAGLSRPTVSRLASTLARLGYLDFDAKSGKYELGPAVLSIGYPLLASMMVRQIARPLMERLAEHCNGVVSMAVRDRLNMVFVESYRSANAILALPDIGATTTVAGSCTGWAHLAACSPADRQAILKQINASDPDAYRNTIGHIAKALNDIAQHGFCTCASEAQRATPAVGAPMQRPVDGRIISFYCGVPAFLLKKGQLEDDVGPRLVAMIQQLELALAGSG